MYWKKIHLLMVKNCDLKILNLQKIVGEQCPKFDSIEFHLRQNKLSQSLLMLLIFLLDLKFYFTNLVWNCRQGLVQHSLFCLHEQFQLRLSPTLLVVHPPPCTNTQVKHSFLPSYTHEGPVGVVPWYHDGNKHLYIPLTCAKSQL